MPEPVWPISAIVPPGGDVEVDVVEHRPSVEVLERDALEADVARPGGSSIAPGRSATSSGSSITWKMRSPDAVARCACPIHMPSERSGSDEHARGRG